MTYDRAANLDRIDALDTELIDCIEAERKDAQDAGDTDRRQRALVMRRAVEVARSAYVQFKRDFPVSNLDTLPPEPPPVPEIPVEPEPTPPVVTPAPDPGFRPAFQPGKKTVLLSGNVSRGKFLDAVREAGTGGIIAADPESGQRAVIEVMGKWHDLEILADQQWLGLDLGRNEPRRAIRGLYLEDCKFGSRDGFKCVHTGFVTEPWNSDPDSFGLEFSRCIFADIWSEPGSEPRASAIYSPRLRDSLFTDCVAYDIGTKLEGTGEPIRNVYSRFSYTRRDDCRNITIRGLLAFDTCDACQLGPEGLLSHSALVGMTNWSAVNSGDITNNLVLAPRDWDAPFQGRAHSAAGLQAWGSGTRINDNILLYQDTGNPDKAFAAIDPRNGSASGNVVYGFGRLHERTDNPDPSEIRMLLRDPRVNVTAVKQAAMDAANRGLREWEPRFSGQHHYQHALERVEALS